MFYGLLRHYVSRNDDKIISNWGWLEILKTLPPYIIAALGILSPHFSKKIELEKHKYQLYLIEKHNAYKALVPFLRKISFKIMMDMDFKKESFTDSNEYTDIVSGYLYFSKDVINLIKRFFEEIQLAIKSSNNSEELKVNFAKVDDIVDEIVTKSRIDLK